MFNVFQSVLSDVSTLTSNGEWSHEERLMLESHLVAATQGPLCLDPNPIPSLATTRLRQSKALLTDHQLMRQAKKFSQVYQTWIYIYILKFKKSPPKSMLQKSWENLSKHIGWLEFQIYLPMTGNDSSPLRYNNNIYTCFENFIYLYLNK